MAEAVVIVLDESSEDDEGSSRGSAIEMMTASATPATTIPAAGAAGSLDSVLSTQPQSAHDEREVGEDEDEAEDEFEPWPFRRRLRKPPQPSAPTIASSFGSSSSASSLLALSSPARLASVITGDDEEEGAMNAAAGEEQKLMAVIPMAPSSSTSTTSSSSSFSFPIIDEEDLLNDLFGTDASDNINRRHPDGDDVKAATAGVNKAKKRLRKAGEEETYDGSNNGKQQPKKTLARSRSRERIIHPKIKPLTVIGGEVKNKKKAALDIEDGDEERQSGAADDQRTKKRKSKKMQSRKEDEEELTEKTLKLVIKKSRQEHNNSEHQEADDQDAKSDADSSLNDSIESVEGEECPICGERYSADELQAHVESELEEQEKRRSKAGGELPPVSLASANDPPVCRDGPMTRSVARHLRSLPEVVVLDDDDEDEAEDEIVLTDEANTAECPFCQQRFQSGVEIEQHVQHEIALQEGRTHTSPPHARAQPAGSAPTDAGSRRKRTQLPLVSAPPPSRKKPRKLPASFDPLEDELEEENAVSTTSLSSSGLTGTLSPFIRRTAQPAGSAAVQAPPVPRTTRPANEASSTAPDAHADDVSQGEADEDEENYDDVTFNFRPLWAASTQEMPYDYQNQFSKEKKKRGRKKAAQEIEREEEEATNLGGDDDEVIEVSPSKRGRKRKTSNTTRAKGSKSSTTSTTKRKSNWRGRRGWGWNRGRAKRGA